MGRILANRVTVSATPTQLSEDKPIRGIVEFTTPVANAGPVFLAGGPGACADPNSRFAIPPGWRTPLHITNLALVWVGGTVGDVVDVIAEVCTES